MLFIARIRGTYGVHFVELDPIGVRFELNTRPRPAVDTIITVVLRGLIAPTHEALDEWRRRHAPTGELGREHYRPLALADLMDAVNAEPFIATARDDSADAIAAFALDRGGVLLSEIRSELARGDEASVAPIVARASRFAEILAVSYAGELLAELATLHAIEHLMGLEHAVAQWIQGATEPPSDELAALARDIPAERTSAGASTVWFRWWWRLARRCTRGDLKTIAVRAVELATRECARAESARATCDEAARMADHVRIATAARMWAEPPPELAQIELDAIVRDDADAHYAAYMAVTHAAHAIAAAARAELDAGDANRYAMQRLAELALAVLAT